MQHITIRHRYTDAVLFELDVADDDKYPMRTALMTAIRAGRDPERLRAELETLRAEPDNTCGCDGCEKQITARASVIAIIERELAAPAPAVELRNMAIVRADLSYGRFFGSSFDGSRFFGSRFDGSRFVGSRFDGSRFDGSRFDGSSFDGSRFVGSRFVDSRFDGSSFDGSSFDGSSFDDSSFDDSSFERCTGAVPTVAAAVPERSPEERDAALAERRRARALRYRANHPDVPVIERLDAKTLAAVEADPHALDMRQWHCGSTHCRGGFAVHHAGDAGRALERLFGTAFAAQKIYLASAGFVPDFSGGTPNDVALADIRQAARIHELAFPSEAAS